MASDSRPKVTVFIPTYNAELYLRDAIDSILRQSFTDFELLIIDDGSTDNTLSVIRQYKDSRIRLLPNPSHQGIGAVRNQALRESRGHFLALLDADDISLESRLQRQYDWLSNNHEIDVVGTWMKRFGNNHRDSLKTPLDHEAIHATMLFRMAVCHASLMFRLDKLRQYRLEYPVDSETAEDYEFCVKAIQYLKFSTLPIVLYQWRQQHSSASNFRREEKENRVFPRIYAMQLEQLGIQPNPTDLEQHTSIARLLPAKNDEALVKIQLWLQGLMAANQVKRIYDQKKFDNILGYYFFQHCAIAMRHGQRNALKRFWGSEFSQVYSPPIMGRLSVLYHRFF